MADGNGPAPAVPQSLSNWNWDLRWLRLLLWWGWWWRPAARSSRCSAAQRNAMQTRITTAQDWVNQLHASGGTRRYPVCGRFEYATSVLARHQSLVVYSLIGGLSRFA